MHRASGGEGGRLSFAPLVFFCEDLMKTVIFFLIFATPLPHDFLSTPLLSNQFRALFLSKILNCGYIFGLLVEKKVEKGV